MIQYISAEEYRMRYNLTKEQFDEYINQYMLDHRFNDGKLLVKDVPPPPKISLEDMLSSKSYGSLPPPPPANRSLSTQTSKPMLSTDVITVNQLAIFKDENKEILKFSEKSLNTMAGYTQTIFKDKERIIDMKSEQINILAEQLKEKDEVIRLLKQQLQDYHLLTSLITK